MAVAFIDYYGVLVYTLNLILWIAPIKSMMNLYKSKDLWQVPYNFYMISLVNCLFWIVYGLQINIWPIWAVNIPGLLSFMGCIILYLFFIKMKTYEFVIMIIALPFKTSLIFFIFYYYVDQEINGYIAMSANILMFIMPSEQIYHVVKSKNNVYIELWLAIAIFINSSAYFVYGILLGHNWDIIIPNGLGFCIAISQLVVWYKYRVPTDYQKVDKIEIHDNDNELSEINTSID